MVLNVPVEIYHNPSTEEKKRVNNKEHTVANSVLQTVRAGPNPGGPRVGTVHGPTRSIRDGPRQSKYRKIKSVPPLALGGRAPTGRHGPIRFGPFCFYKFKKL
jgi:hypothetical protein